VCLCLQVGLVFVSRSMKYVLAGLLAVSVVSLIAAMFTSFGFPYRADPASPTRQRLVVHVCSRLSHYPTQYSTLLNVDSA